MAYVVVQHMDPKREGMLPELLRRMTKIKVTEVSDGVRVEPDRIYVIPSNKKMIISNGKLQLSETVLIGGLRLPIDHFFRSLAAELHERAVGVILSGMGADGALGMMAIKENHGLTAVQDPETAGFDSMPRRASDLIHVDIKAQAAELPGRIADILDAELKARKPSEKPAKKPGVIEKIIKMVSAATGNDFSQYKENMIQRRIERRMAVCRINDMESYAAYLQKHTDEAERMFKEIMIGVTNFFRNPEMWDKLKTDIIPALIKENSAKSSLRAWVPACSTGEEAYTLAIVFREAMEQSEHYGKISLQIFATDLDERAVEKARKGVFGGNIAADVSQKRLNKYFKYENNTYKISSQIREMIVFASQNVVKDPPFNNLDIITCRNMLIYMNSALQDRVIKTFQYSLNPGGILVLGSAEAVGSSVTSFDYIDIKNKIYSMKSKGGKEIIHLPQFAAKKVFAGGLKADSPKKRSGSKAGAGVIKKMKNLRDAQEEMQTSQEELKSVNEELQSTNEELTTSKEEMQSLNEELQTVNTEMQSKLNIYENLNNDLKNLLDSTKIAVLFLDKKNCITQFTTAATGIFNLRQADIGRPFTDLTSRITYPEITDDIEGVLRTLAFTEKDVAAEGSNWYKARIMPYRTTDDRIEGTVITFTDITVSKKLEATLREIEMKSKAVMNSVSNEIASLSKDGNVLSLNKAAVKYFNVNETDAVGKNYFELLVPEASRAEAKAAIKSLSEGTDTVTFETDETGTDGQLTRKTWQANRLVDQAGRVNGVIVAGQGR